MSRFGLLERLLLIMLSALLVVSVAALLLVRWQAAHHPSPAPFTRITDFAADVDLLAGVPVETWPAILRATRGQSIRLVLAPEAPSIEGFISAPKLAAKLHRVAKTPAGATAQVFTNVDQQHRNPKDGVEGYLALVFATMPDGRTLSATPIFQRESSSRLLGLPPPLWIGIIGAVTAALAVLGASRELRSLRALSKSLSEFDGLAPEPVMESHGAPDVRALAAAVNGMQRRVSTLMRERNVMIGGVSHDLRTLLTRLQLRVSALAEPEIRTSLTADLDMMGALVESAVAYARGIEVGLARVSIDLADLVATEIAEREAVGVRIAIESQLTDAPVEADVVALRRVAANVMDNASLFGRSRMLITVGIVEGQALLVVEDDGPGVPQQEWQAVFLPFYRVDARGLERAGVGLGLAIASRLVEAHGGTLEMGVSQLGGAKVTMRIPAAPRSAHPPQTMAGL